MFSLDDRAGNVVTTMRLHSRGSGSIHRASCDAFFRDVLAVCLLGGARGNVRAKPLAAP